MATPFNLAPILFFISTGFRRPHVPHKIASRTLISRGNRKGKGRTKRQKNTKSFSWWHHINCHCSRYFNGRVSTKRKKPWSPAGGRKVCLQSSGTAAHPSGSPSSLSPLSQPPFREQPSPRLAEDLESGKAGDSSLPSQHRGGVWES